MKQSVSAALEKGMSKSGIITTLVSEDWQVQSLTPSLQKSLKNSLKAATSFANLVQNAKFNQVSGKMMTGVNLLHKDPAVNSILHLVALYGRFFLFCIFFFFFVSLFFLLSHSEMIVGLRFARLF
jgi:hypothetical protein